MIADWFKRMLPRGLYGRAALILVLPIVVIQIVVSIAFIQRYFEDVSRQMTIMASLDVNLIAARARAAPDAELAADLAGDLAASLAMNLELPVEPAPAGPDLRMDYDLSGRAVIETFRASVDGLVLIDLTRSRLVRLVLATPHGPMELSFDRRRVSAANPHQLLVVMVVAGILMTLIASLFLRNQLRPIRRLARAAEAFGKGRILPYKPAGATEVRAAGNAFLDMRARIERQLEQRMLLLSGVSHDLRTPLTRLKLALSMLDNDAETSAMNRDVAEMQRLLDAFLAFVRDEAVEEGPVRQSPADFLAAVIEDSRRAGQPVSLISVSGEGDAPFRAGAVRRALDNLLNNAARYGGRIEVSLAILDRSWRIAVEDDGPGIAQDRREEALQPFTRLDPARNQDKGSGVGLGLAISADIARQHGGALRLGKSERLGGLKAELVFAR
ncbi:MAG: HAMP domain-containing protein [Rhodobacteraceae bacterium]|nr:HAMP domain-containing protein [Paracoccaceae bacterium]